jgi:hypothetical protein
MFLGGIFMAFGDISNSQSPFMSGASPMDRNSMGAGGMGKDSIANSMNAMMESMGVMNQGGGGVPDSMGSMLGSMGATPAAPDAMFGQGSGGASAAMAPTDSVTMEGSGQQGGVPTDQLSQIRSILQELQKMDGGNSQGMQASMGTGQGAAPANGEKEQDGKTQAKEAVNQIDDSGLTENGWKRKVEENDDGEKTVNYSKKQGDKEFGIQIDPNNPEVATGSIKEGKKTQSTEGDEEEAGQVNEALTKQIQKDIGQKDNPFEDLMASERNSNFMMAFGE